MLKLTEKKNLSRLIKREIRKSVNAESNCPISIIDGDSPPILVGESYHYQNKSGDKIQYPNAYRKAWGKPVYINSTRRIEVGSDWLLNQMSLYNFRLLRLKVLQ
jgi:hypothetical protein